MVSAAFKGKFVVLEAVHPSNVPPNAIFVDATNGNEMTVKGAGGGTSPIGGGASNYFIKSMIAAGPIAMNRPVSKRPLDGKIEAADSDAVQGQDFVGWAQSAAVGDGSVINVMLAGPNLAGALLGKGFHTGDEIYLSEDGLGYTNDGGSFTGGNDSLIRVGIADCAAGEASTTAVDLIGFCAVISRP